MDGPAVSAEAYRSTLLQMLRQDARRLWRVAFGVLRDAQMAEDACQQAVLKAWQGQHELRETQGLRAWLLRVTVNESLQMLRRRKLERRYLQAASVTEHAAPPDVELERREALLMAMLVLPMELQEVVTLRIINDLSGNEVKELLGCSAAEVSRRLHQGLELLRDVLGTERPAGRRPCPANKPAN